MVVIQEHSVVVNGEENHQIIRLPNPTCTHMNFDRVFHAAIMRRLFLQSASGAGCHFFRFVTSGGEGSRRLQNGEKRR